jgi:hypothetical protein
MSQAIKDWIEQDRERIVDDYCNGDRAYPEALRALERLGFGTQEARDMLNEALQ